MQLLPGIGPANAERCLKVFEASGFSWSVLREYRMPTGTAEEWRALVALLKYYITQQSRTGDAHVYGARSRFMTELLLESFELKAWPASSEHTKRALETKAAVRVDAVSALRGMWE